jgi:uncharacterized protein (TIGR02611 family)
MQTAPDTRRRMRPRRPRWTTLGPGKLVYRVGIGVLGGLVLAGGIVMIPYPGPGWLVVFAGLAILATEFHWARRLLDFARGRYHAWTRWLAGRHLLIRLTVLALTGLIVLVTLWLLDVCALVGGWFGIEWPWLGSPLFR